MWEAGRPLYRIHARGRGAWWFGRSGRQRFDPVAAAGIGACYLAERPLGAWVEVFRTGLYVDELDIRSRSLARVSLDRDLQLADLLSRDALRYGATGSLTAGADYDEAQMLASRLAAGEFDGVRWHVRHDPAHQLTGVALFGPAGSPQDPERWPDRESSPIGDELIAEAAREFGYVTLPRPI